MAKTNRLYLFLVIFVLLVSATLTSPALAALDQPPPGAVHAAPFWMDGCPHCHYVLNEVFPPLQGKYGDQLQIHLIELITAKEVDSLYQTAAAFGIPKEHVQVPFMIVGEHVLVSSEQIPVELPGLIEKYLAAGGVDYPDIPALAEFLPTPAQIVTSDPVSTPASVAAQDPPVVHLLLFWTPDCHACRTVVAETLPLLKEKYGEHIVVEYVDVVTGEDVDRLYQIAAAFGISQEQADLPMLIVGDHALVGAEQIPAELPGLVSPRPGRPLEQVP